MEATMAVPVCVSVLALDRPEKHREVVSVDTNQPFPDLALAIRAQLSLNGSACVEVKGLIDGTDEADCPADPHEDRLDDSHLSPFWATGRSFRWNP